MSCSKRQTKPSRCGGRDRLAELADDIAFEARLALQLTDEIKELEERMALLFPGRSLRDLRLGSGSRNDPPNYRDGSATRIGLVLSQVSAHSVGWFPRLVLREWRTKEAWRYVPSRGDPLVR
jgi:hypothetical protein